MSLGTLQDTEDDFSAEINTTPLVDVMLVLLIIFIITMPVINHAVKIDLPEASSQVLQAPPDAIQLSIDAEGQLLWNKDRITHDDLVQRIEVAAQKDPQPELHLFAARTTPYENIAHVMSKAQKAGLSKIGFVTTSTNASTHENNKANINDGSHAQ